MAEIDYVVVTAGSFDILAEVVCESDEQLLEMLSTRIRTLPGRALDRDLRLPATAQADLLVGRALSVELASTAHAGTTTAGCRCGTRRPTTTGCRGRRCRAAPRSTWRSSVPASPGCGPRTTWRWPTPTLRIMVLEREVAGFGASGRNGGWCSALFPASAAKIARRAGDGPAAGRDAAVRMLAAMRDTVGEVGRVVAAEGIDAHWQQGGTLELARSSVQLRRLRAEVTEARELGIGTRRPSHAGRRRGGRRPVPCPGCAGPTYTPHCAAVHPARLVRGLARAVERRGVRHPRADAGDRHPPVAGRHARGHGARGGGGARDRGLHPLAGRASAARWRRSTR